MKLTDRFAYLVYPFVNDLPKERATRSSGRRRLSELDSLWQPWQERLNTEAHHAVQNDSFYFLPFIRQLLFPGMASETGEVAGTGGRPAATRDLVSFATAIAEDAVLHLTLADRPKRMLRDLRLETRFGDGNSWAVMIDWIDLLLFPQTVGFLVIALRFPERQTSSVDDFSEFLQAARLVHAPSLDYVLPFWTAASEEEAFSFTSQELVDFLLQGWVTDVPELVAEDLGTFLGRQPPSYTYTGSDFAQIYGAAFHLYVYALLKDTPEGLNVQPFESPVEKSLFHLVFGFDPCTSEGRPHSRRLEIMRRNNVLALWNNWQGLIYPGSTIILGARRDEITAHRLPQYLESEYFYVHLLTLYQKFRLSLIGGELLRREKDVHRRRREAKKLWDVFIRFQNLYWKREVSPLHQGEELYKRFQEGLGIDSLYRRTREEVRQLQEYYERRNEKRVGRLLNVLTLFGLPASLWVGLFGSALIKDASHAVEGSWPLALATGGAMVILTASAWLLWRLVDRN